MIEIAHVRVVRLEKRRRDVGVHNLGAFDVLVQVVCERNLPEALGSPAKNQCVALVVTPGRCWVQPGAGELYSDNPRDSHRRRREATRANAASP